MSHLLHAAPHPGRQRSLCHGRALRVHAQLACRPIRLIGRTRLAVSPPDGTPAGLQSWLSPVCRREHAGANSIIGVNAVAALTAHLLRQIAYAANTTLYPALPYNPADLVASLMASPLLAAVPNNAVQERC
jgi:hypothetical protein